MKKLLPLMILSTLVACGGKSGGGNSNADILHGVSETLLANTTRGMVSLETEIGKENSLEFTDETAEVKTETVNRKSKETVLKIEGSLVYKLVEREDLVNGSTSKQINIDDMMDNGNPNAIKDLTITKTDKSMLITGSVDVGYEYNNVIMENIVGLSAIISLTKPCESTQTMKDISAAVTIKGTRQTLPNYEKKTVTSCGKTLSTSELKALDLTNMTFCDSRTEDYTCETKDMSYLTSDL